MEHVLDVTLLIICSISFLVAMSLFHSVLHIGFGVHLSV